MPLASRNRVSCTSEAFEIAKDKPETHVHIVPRLQANFTRPVAFSILALVAFAQLLAFGLVLLIAGTSDDTPSTNKLINSSSVLAITPNFSVEAAYAHLEVITRHPHFFNMRANDQVRNYILGYANNVRRQINPHLEVLDDDTRVAFTGEDTPSGLFGSSNVTGYLESGNVLVRIRGSANTGNALLVSAHFDSAQLSYGANDNGIGVAAAMEMVRLAALHPPKHDLIFNFNNFEEAGVLGSVAFMAHEWAPTVKAFLNLEGAGAGGRVLLFQCSNPRLAELARAIPRPTTSVLGNDLFQMRVINSVTDYGVYSGKKNIPGVDFAIFRNRAVYHTMLDNIQHAYTSTLESMGQSLWPLAQAIDESDFLESEPRIQSAGIFYSLLSLTTFQYSFVTDHILGATVILFIVLTIFFYFSFTSLQRGFRPDTISSAVWPPAKALLMILTGLVLFGLVSFGVNSLIIRFNPLSIHRHWILIYLLNMLQAALCLAIADWLFRGKRPCRKRFQASTLAMAGLWLMLMLIQRIAGMAHIGILYFLTWFVYTYICTYALSLVVDPINYWTKRPVVYVSRIRELSFIVVQIILTVFVPCLLLHDSATNVMISMCQSLITGTPPIIVYSLASFFGIVATLPIIPFLSLAGDYHKFFVSAGSLLWTIILITSLLVTPLSSHDPATLFWSQTYDLSTRESPVSISGIFGLDEVAPSLLRASAKDPEAFNLIPSSPFSVLRYEGLEPTFEVPPSHLINVTTHVSTNTFKSFILEAHDTRKCRILIPTSFEIDGLKVSQRGKTKSLSTATYLPVFSSAFTTGSTSVPTHLIYLMRRSFAANPWIVSFNCSAPTPIPIQVSCYYDDYDSHVPALAPITKTPQNFLPATITLAITNHVLEVKQKFTI